MASNYLLGCSGWYYTHWKDKFYSGKPKKDWFNYYSSKFNTVELNSTFYHFPQEKIVEGWYKNSPDDFVYSIKANRMITHLMRFQKTENIVNSFYGIISGLYEKLGCVLFQFPPSLHFDAKRLREIIKQFNPRYKNVIEFRHKSWWNEETYDILQENNVIFCIVSGPMPENFIKTSPDIYVRFHGKPRYLTNYTKGQLRKYAGLMEGSKAKNVWAYFNNDFNAYAPKNCLELKKIVGGK